MEGLKLIDIEENKAIKEQMRRGRHEQNSFESEEFKADNKISLDLTYMFNSPGKEPISRNNVESLIPKVMKAHQMLKDNEGDIYDADIPMTGWQTLPSEITKDHIEKIKSIVSDLTTEIDAFISLGIGGSYLGIEATFRAVTHQYFNQLNKNRGVVLRRSIF